MSKCIYSVGDYSVLWDDDAFRIETPREAVSAIDVSYALTPYGLALAITIARHQGAEALHHNGRSRAAEAAYCMAEGARIFALGQRKAHAEWLEG